MSLFSEVCVFVRMHPKTRIWQLTHHNCAHLKVSQSSCINNLTASRYTQQLMLLNPIYREKFQNFWDALEFPENSQGEHLQLL